MKLADFFESDRAAVDAALDRPVSDLQWKQLDPSLRGRAISEVR